MVEIEDRDVGDVVFNYEQPVATTWRRCKIRDVKMMNCRITEPLVFQACDFSGDAILWGNFVTEEGAIVFDELCTWPKPPHVPALVRAKLAVRGSWWEARRRVRLAWSSLLGRTNEDDE